MSVKMMARVWAQSIMKDGKLLVMLALADFANDTGECWPSVPTLAAKARLTDRQTRRVLDELEAAHEIERIRSNGGRNQRTRYRIILSENPDKITLKELQGKNNTVIGDIQNPDICDTKTLTPASGAYNRHRTVSKENRQIEDIRKAPIVPKGDDFLLFNQFWNAWPEHKRKTKWKAWRAWQSINPDAILVRKIMSKLDELKKKCNQWNRDNGRFIPYPASWLNAGGWDDEVDDFIGSTQRRFPD